METFDGRLATFNVAHTITKKRTSNAKGAGKVRWPHKSPDPAQLARAGFFYNPTSTTPDNTTCYLCHNSLDGWEEDDSAIGEHLNFASDCGWAVNVRVEQDIEDGNLFQQDPMDERLLNARKMTFGAGWPHEDKRGWVCKTQKSNLTTTSENVSIVEANAKMNDIASTSTGKLGILGSGQDTIGAKKAVRGKRGAPKTKQKDSAVQPEETVPGSSFVEPEDDDFEVKVEQKSSRRAVGNKRKSDEMSIGNKQEQPEMKHASRLPQIPPAKRRATRSSVTYANRTASSSLHVGQTDDSVMTDAKTTHLPPSPIPKKATKGRKRKAPSSARKASTTSAASKASLRATQLDDEEIDAALEADLDRPLTDDEVEQDPPTMPMTKSRRLTRTRPSSRNVTASTASVRRATCASALPVDGESMASVDASANDAKDETAGKTEAVEIAVIAMDHAKQGIAAETDGKMTSKARTGRKAPPKPLKPTKKGKEAKREGDNVSNSENIHQEPVGKYEPSEVPESQQRPEELPGRTPRTSHIPIENSHCEPAGEINSSASDHSVTYEICGIEPQDDEVNPSHLKMSAKRRSAAAEKSRSSEEGVAACRNQTDVMHIESEAKSNGLVVLVEVELGEDRESVTEAKLPVVTPTKEIPQGELRGAKGGDWKAAKSKKSGTSVPSVASSTTQAEPIEAPLVEPHQHEAGGDLPTPEDSQCIVVRCPTSTAQVPSDHQTPKSMHSPQSSDAENQPPSARPSALRPPLLVQTPSKTQAARVPLAATTPTASPSKRNVSRLQSTLPWTSIDFDKIFSTPSTDKENIVNPSLKDPKQGLSSPERKLTLEEWVRWNAERGEAKLREGCERLVGSFEAEGVRALKTLEGIICAE
ncbi:MAG: hypothetical protein Q9207_002547 [Kuettlingeria erythrocarpa]